MISNLKSKLSQKQKSQAKYLISIFNSIHIKSLIRRQPNFSYRKLFSNLMPVSTNLELVRIGGFFDGSYLVPILKIEYDGVISPGVGQSIEFEKAIAEDKCLVVLIDGTVSPPQNLPQNFVFLDKMLGSHSEFVTKTISLKELISRFFPTSRSLVLQMDIEGGEHDVLNSLEEDDLNPFAAILVEYHQLDNLSKDDLWNSRIRRSVEIFQKDFQLIHTHPNNAGGFFLWRFKKIPKVVETTWVRKSLINSVHGQAKLPHPLDRRNDLLMEDLKFPMFKQAK